MRGAGSISPTIYVFNRVLSESDKINLIAVSMLLFYPIFIAENAGNVGRCHETEEGVLAVKGERERVDVE